MYTIYGALVALIGWTRPRCYSSYCDFSRTRVSYTVNILKALPAVFSYTSRNFASIRYF